MVRHAMLQAGRRMPCQGQRSHQLCLLPLSPALYLFFWLKKDEMGRDRKRKRVSEDKYYRS